MDSWQIVASLADWVGTALFVVLIALGKLIPRSTVERSYRQYEERIEDAKSVAKQASAQVESAMESMRLVAHVVEALPKPTPADDSPESP